MRWHVHGTDAITGEDVELAVNEPQAEDAIRSAIDRRIVVDRITGEGGANMRRLGRLIFIAGFIALACTSVGLYVHTHALHGALDQAAADQELLQRSIAKAESTAAEIRTHYNLAAATDAQVKKLMDELSAARTGKTLAEGTAESWHARASDLEQEAATRTKDLMDQRDAARAQVDANDKVIAQLRGDMAMQVKRMDQLEHLPPPDGSAAAAIAKVEATNKDLQAEIERLQQELLVAAARIAPAPAPAPEPEAPPAAEPSSLRVSYDAARDYLTLHADHDSFLTKPVDGTTMLASSGVLTDNALRLRFMHDRAKAKVFSATMVISLAADAPKEKAAENAAFIAEFLHVFVPTIHDTGAIVAAAGQLAGQDATRRVMFVVDDCKISVWNNKDGLFTFQVESGRDLLE